MGSQPNIRIFICYRRADVGTSLAPRLAAYLREQLDNADVFVDERSVGFGPYPHQLLTWLASAHIVIALIGHNWHGTDAGGSRIADPEDWVRRELEASLRADKLVVPLLCDGARLLRSADLPLSLRPLVDYQTYILDSTRFEDDASRLADAITAEALSPTLRQRDVEDAAHATLIELVTALQQEVLAKRIALGSLTTSAKTWMDRTQHGLTPGTPLDADAKQLLAAAHDLLLVFQKTPRQVYRYTPVHVHGAVIDGMALAQVDLALRVGNPDRYAFENASRAFLATANLINAGVAVYESGYRTAGTSLMIPQDARYLVATSTRKAPGISLLATDGLSFTSLGVYSARAMPLRRVQLRAAPNQEPKLYAHDERSVYRWGLGQTQPEMEWPIPDDDLNVEYGQLHVLQGERIELLTGEGRNGRRWLKRMGRPELFELATRARGTGASFTDGAAGPLGILVTDTDVLVEETIDVTGKVAHREIPISAALHMRPDLFALGDLPRAVQPPVWLELAEYNGYRCVLADCVLEHQGEAILFLDARTGTWLRTPALGRSFRGRAQLITLDHRRYLVRACSSHGVAAMVWDVSDPVELDAARVVAGWGTHSYGHRCVSATAGTTPPLVLCSATDSLGAPEFALLRGEGDLSFRPVELPGAGPDLHAAVALQRS